MSCWTQDKCWVESNGNHLFEGSRLVSSLLE